MRRLFLLRHAKSSWDADTADDFDRTLDDRGERAAAAMAVYCRQIGLRPGRVICSPAKRTRETWARIAAELEAPPEADFDRAVYEAAPEALLAVIAATPADVRDVLLVGHNPGMHILATTLAAAAIAKFPTGALAILELDCEDWSDLKPDCGRLVDFIVPKALI